MKRLRIILRILAAWSLLILALINIVNYARTTRDNWTWFINVNEKVDEVTRWENRFAQLKTHIPADTKVVGYIAGDSQKIEFDLTQYAIIPQVLRAGTAPAWIIANYNGKPIRQVLQKLGLNNYSLENYGYGLYLIHKK